MTLPPAVLERLEQEAGRIIEVVSLGGGDHAVYRCSAGGQDYFVKYAATAAAPADFFAVEAAGLDLLRSGGSALKVPAVLQTDSTPVGSWIALEWLERSPHADFSAELGRGLALLHRTRATRWGWDRDGYIGRLPQSNRSHARWWEFWWEERLLPQIRLAGGRFETSSWLEDLPVALEEILAPAEPEGPCLLHGDLWSGNVMSSTAGPAIFDPACCSGHREVDLAMSELFGGFDRSFYTAYDEVSPRLPEYEWRRDAYQLYYLLVHVNLYGGSYVDRTRDALLRVLAATAR